MTRRHALLFIAAFMLCTGCGDDSTPSGPTANNNTLPGTWVGTIAYSLGSVGRGNVTLNIQNAQANGTYAGTWTFEFADISNNRQGSLTTSVPRETTIPGAGSVMLVEFDLQPSSTPVCQELPGFPPDYGLELGLRRNTLSGDSLISECGQLFPGRVELTRR